MLFASVLEASLLEEARHQDHDQEQNRKLQVGHNSEQSYLQETSSKKAVHLGSDQPEVLGIEDLKFP